MAHLSVDLMGWNSEHLVGPRLGEYLAVKLGVHLAVPMDRWLEVHLAEMMGEEWD